MFKHSLALSAIVCLASSIASASTIVGPLPYTSVLDRPAGFFSIDAGELLCLEDFEGDAEPGYRVDIGERIGPKTISGDGIPVTDSVDGDDGAIDGDGVMGSSLFSEMRTLQVTFDTPSTAVGFALTDGDNDATKIIVEGFSETGELVCEHTFDSFFDDVFTGTTAEDRFIGLQAPEGISRLRISIDRGEGIEIDHLQFIKPVPEPSALAVACSAALGGLSLVRRRRRRR